MGTFFTVQIEVTTSFFVSCLKHPWGDAPKFGTLF